MHSMTSRKGCKRIYGESYEEYRKSMFDDIAMLQGLLSDKSGVTPVTFAYPFGFISEKSPLSPARSNWNTQDYARPVR